jgi:DNA-binding NarL/FixJ family response regulator
MAFPIEEMEDGFDPTDDGSSLKRDLTRLCGAEAADKFLQAFAGCRYRIPYRPSIKSRLAQAIGHENATAFAAEYGGEVMDVPGGELLAWNQRRLRIEKMLIAGAASYDVAREAGCTERTVRKTRARLRAKGVIA